MEHRKAFTPIGFTLIRTPAMAGNLVGVKGFTLIELLVVMAILAVLIAGTVLALNPAKRLKQGNDSKIQSDIGQVGLALKAYSTDNSYYPALLTELRSE